MKLNIFCLITVFEFRLVTCDYGENNGYCSGTEYVSGTIGIPLELNCTIKQPRMYINWFGPPNNSLYAIGNKIAPKLVNCSNIKIVGDEGKHEHVLQILPFSDEYTGLFKCSTTLGHQCFNVTRNDSSIVTVHVESGLKKSIIEGDTVSLNCSFSCDNSQLTINWKFNGIGLMESNSELRFDRINRNNTGNYTCFVTCNGSLKKGSTEITVNYAPNVSVTVEHHNSTTYVFQCMADGNPTAYTFHLWEHKTAFGNHVRFFSASQDGRLVIFKMTEQLQDYQNAGIYICRVSNGIKNRKGLIYGTGRIQFEIKGKPSFLRSNSRNHFAVSGQRASVEIFVYCYPQCNEIILYGDKGNRLNVNNTDNMTGKHAIVLETSQINKTEIYLEGNTVSIAVLRIQITTRVLQDSDFGSMTLEISNSFGASNFTFELKQATSEYGTAVVAYGISAVAVVIVTSLVICSLLRTEKGKRVLNGIRQSCTLRQSVDNAGIVAVGNDMYEIQNNEESTQRPAVEVPTYSSIDRTQNLNINQCVSYCVSKKKKPNPLGFHQQKRGDIDQQFTPKHAERCQTSQCSDKETGQLNYIEVSFDKNSDDRLFKIRGLDKRSSYVDIDFTRKPAPLPEDDSDDDFASVEDVKGMYKTNKIY